MSDSFFSEIDWSRPWLRPYSKLGLELVQSRDWRIAFNELARTRDLRNHRGHLLHLVPQQALPAGVPYESFISETGGVPTRENLHDFFNALVWLTFPKLKARLNALHAEAMAGNGVGDRAAVQSTGRGKLRDAATLFDENGALLMSSDASLLDALRRHSWQEVFVTRRDDFQRHCRIFLFGHALLEKLVTPYKAITAHALPMSVSDEVNGVGQVGAMQVAGLEMLDFRLTAKAFTPLPVLGIPGWWVEQRAAFYEDASVFRPMRR